MGINSGFKGLIWMQWRILFAKCR